MGMEAQSYKSENVAIAAPETQRLLRDLEAVKRQLEELLSKSDGNLEFGRRGSADMIRGTFSERRQEFFSNLKLIRPAIFTTDFWAGHFWSKDIFTGQIMAQQEHLEEQISPEAVALTRLDSTRLGSVRTQLDRLYAEPAHGEVGSEKYKLDQMLQYLDRPGVITKLGELTINKVNYGPVSIEALEGGDFKITEETNGSSFTLTKSEFVGQFRNLILKMYDHLEAHSSGANSAAV